MRLAIFLTLFCCEAVDAADFKLVCQHGTPIADRTRGWSGHIDNVSWVDEDHVVFAAKGSVASLDVTTQKIVWSLAGIREIDSWSISTGTRRLVFSERSAAPFDIAARSISMVDCATGKRQWQLSDETLAKVLGSDYVNPGEVALFPADGRLLFCDYARSYGRHAHILDDSGTKSESQIEMDASPRGISLSADGRFLSVVADDEVLCVRDLKASREIFFRGKRVLQDPEVNSFTVDIPFYSHIRSDGRSVIYTQDNSWATGRLFVHDLTQKSTKSFDARNGHIEMDVNFPARRIVLTGTEAGLTLLDFDGKEIAHLNKASLQRNRDVEFSPSGKRVAVGSWDNALYVYEIVE